MLLLHLFHATCSFIFGKGQKQIVSDVTGEFVLFPIEKILVNKCKV